MSTAQLLQAEYDHWVDAICDTETPAAERREALRRVTELRSPLKVATDEAIAYEVHLDVTYRL